MKRQAEHGRDCGPHDLVPVVKYLSDGVKEIYAVVRWCCTCGAITVDEETHGRTAPGKITPMKTPRGIPIP